MSSRKADLQVKRHVRMFQPESNSYNLKRRSEYTRLALLEAQSMTLTEREVSDLLNGRDLTAVVPPRSGRTPPNTDAGPRANSWSVTFLFNGSRWEAEAG